MSRKIKNSWRHKLWPLLYAVLLLIVLLESVAVAGKDGTTVRIGYYHEDNFQEGRGPEDVKSGYAYEYYQKLAQFTDWSYEYVYADYDALYQMLLKGEIDFLAGLAYIPEREGLVLYPKQSMGEEHYDLIRCIGNNTVTGNLASLNGKRIGILSGAQEKVAREYLAAQGIQAELTVYANMKQRDRALRSGEVDTIIAEDSMGEFAGLEAYAQIGTTDYFIGVNRHRPDLRATLEAAQEKLLERNPDIYAGLRRKHLQRTAFRASLTEEERDWLKAHEVIRVGYLEDAMPFSATNERGEADGIIRDIMPQLFKEIQGAEKLRFDLKGYKTSGEMQRLLAQGEIDVVFPADADNWIGEKTGNKLTEGFVVAPWRVIFKDGKYNKSPKSFAILQNSILNASLADIYFPHATRVFGQSKAELIEAVQSGKAEATMMDSYAISRLSGTAIFHGLSSQVLDVRSFGFGVAADNVELLGLLNRAISLQGPNFTQDILLRYNASNKEFSVMDFVYQHFILVLAVALLVIALGVVHIIFRAKAAKRDKALTKKLQKAFDQQEAHLAEIIGLNKQLENSQLVKQQQYAVLESMAEIFYTLHVIDLNADTVEEISAHNEIRALVNLSQGATDAMAQIMNATIEADFKEAMLKFSDLTTIAERMKHRKVLSGEFKGIYTGWILAMFIVIKRDEAGNPVKLIFSTRVIDEEKREKEKLLKKTQTDEMTGLLNRRAYEEDVYAQKRIPQENEFVYIAIDLNSLKVVNDTLGHVAGDEIIVGACQCMKQVLGPHGKLYRTGGDEFVAIAFVSLDRLQLILQEFEQVITAWSGKLVDRLSMSYGYAAKEEFPEASVAALAAEAEKRMYKAKSAYYQRQGVDRRGQQEAHKVLCSSYAKILQINLQEDTYRIVNITDGEQSDAAQNGNSLSRWLYAFGASGNVHEADVQEYQAKTSLSYLQEYFRTNQAPYCIFYRRKYGDAYKRVMMEIIPANDYAEDNQNMFLYVKCIEM